MSLGWRFRRNLYVENNLKQSWALVGVYRWSALQNLLDLQGRKFGCGLMGLGKFHGLHGRNYKWDALSWKKGAPLEGRQELTSSWGQLGLRRSPTRFCGFCIYSFITSFFQESWWKESVWGTVTGLTVQSWLFFCCVFFSLFGGQKRVLCGLAVRST